MTWYEKSKRVWFTVDGEIAPDGTIKVWPAFGYQSSCYMVEVAQDDLGMNWTVSRYGYTIVESIQKGESYEKLRETVNIGDVLVAINDRVVIHEHAVVY